MIADFIGRWRWVRIRRARLPVRSSERLVAASAACQHSRLHSQMTLEVVVKLYLGRLSECLSVRLLATDPLQHDTPSGGLLFSDRPLLDATVKEGPCTVSHTHRRRDIPPNEGEIGY